MWTWHDGADCSKYEQQQQGRPDHWRWTAVCDRHSATVRKRNGGVSAFRVPKSAVHWPGARDCTRLQSLYLAPCCFNTTYLRLLCSSRSASCCDRESTFTRVAHLGEWRRHMKYEFTTCPAHAVSAADRLLLISIRHTVSANIKISKQQNSASKWSPNLLRACLQWYCWLYPNTRVRTTYQKDPWVLWAKPIIKHTNNWNKTHQPPFHWNFCFLWH